MISRMLRAQIELFSRTVNDQFIFSPFLVNIFLFEHADAIQNAIIIIIQNKEIVNSKTILF